MPRLLTLRFRYVSRVLNILVFLFAVIQLGWGQESADASPLAEGHWAQITIVESGVYRLTFDELRRAGFEDPTKVRLFGRGGRMLSETLEENDINLLPVPTYIEGETLYFYGEGVVRWLFDRDHQSFFPQTHLYSRTGGYLLTDRSDLPQPRIGIAATESATTGRVYTSFSTHLLHERDLRSLKESGRVLFGEPLNSSSPLRITLPTRQKPVQGQPAKLHVAYAALPDKGHSVTLTMSLGGERAEDQIQRSEDYSAATYLAGIYHSVVRTLPTAMSGSEQVVELQTAPMSRSSFLDFIALTIPVELSYEGEQLLFRNFSSAAQEVARHQIALSSQGTGLRLWRISMGRTEQVPLTMDGSAASFVGRVMDEEGSPTEYVLFALRDARSVVEIRELPSQDLLGGAVPDYVILTTDLLRPEAERLAQYHRDHSHLTVRVVSQREVFNEFTSGIPDATAYRLLLWHYKQRYESAHGVGAYHPLLLLLGDGAYDNRKVTHAWQSPGLQSTEFLLTYQGENSTNVYSYTTDDYFGLLSEGQRGVSVGGQPLSVGIGRLPVRTLSEARSVIDKIIRYDSEPVPGVWRTRACYVADNMDGYSHLRQADEIATYMSQLQPEIMISKIYMDAFAHRVENGRTSVPDARRKLFDELRRGLLLLDYTGHGGPAAWSDEQILTLPDIIRFDYQHLPVWITATCDFSNFDHPNTSAGETALLHPSSGAIALYTTTRVVMDLDNKRMNLALHRSLFTPESDGRLRPMGIVMRDAKNELTPDDKQNKLNFLLLGDPALRLRMPSYQLLVTEINGIPLTEEHQHQGVPLHAMDKVRVKGYLADHQATIQGDFTGKLFVTIYNAQIEVRTHVDNAPDKDSDYITTFQDYPGVLYAGVAEVQSGFFDFSFVVPKDLTYAESNGRINLYAYSDKMGEAMGVSSSIRITPGGGEHELRDTIPPLITSYYIGHPDFSAQHPVGSTPLFVAEIEESSGLNLSGTGVGHDMRLEIDGRADMNFVLNEYYTASELEAGKGRVVYLLPELSEGDHSARFVVWDVFNNCTQLEFTFRVRVGQAPTIIECRAIPTILKPGEEMRVELYSDAPGVESDARVMLYDYRGVKVGESERMVVRSSVDAPAVLRWSPANSAGGALPSGLYIYRVELTSGKSLPAYYSGKVVLQ